MKRAISQQEVEFVQDVQQLRLITSSDGRLFTRECINVTNCYEKVVDFFRLVRSIADKKVYETLPLKGWKFLGIKSKSRRCAEEAKKLFVDSIHEVLSSEHYPRIEVISGAVLFFGEPIFSVSECKNVIDPKFQEKTRLEITEFVESFDGKFPLDWIAD